VRLHIARQRAATLRSENSDARAAIPRALRVIVPQILSAGDVRNDLLASKNSPRPSETNEFLDEFEWRFNNRKNPFLFRDTMLKLISSANLEYKN